MKSSIFNNNIHIDTSGSPYFKYMANQIRLVMAMDKLSLQTRAPIGAKINQCHFGESRLFVMGCPKYVCPDFRGGAKKQPAPWHGGTGQMGALENAHDLYVLTTQVVEQSTTLENSIQLLFKQSPGCSKQIKCHTSKLFTKLNGFRTRKETSINCTNNFYQRIPMRSQKQKTR